jgi:hypothetical protein
MFVVLLSGSKLNGVTIKFVSYFFIVYLGFALLDVSNYRGAIELVTLKVYCQVVLGSFFILCMTELLEKKENLHIYKHSRVINTNQNIMVLTHLAIVYVVVALIYAKYGMVLLNQDLRFGIPTSLGYIVKSSIYIPLIFWASSSERNRKFLFVYVLLPLFPAILIGSRGTVVMILLGLVLIQMLQSMNGIKFPKERVVVFQKRIFIWVCSFGGGIIYLLYYIRRMSPDTNFLSPSEALNQYFYSDSWVGYLIMPLHLGFKETLGLTNRIIVENLPNDFTNVPLFIADLITILPGKQIGAGEAMAEMFGAVAAGGLTPGIVGGLYVDFLGWSVLLIVLIITALYRLEIKARYSDGWLVIFVLSLIQFMHLFHRGFVKPEYLFAYLIVLVYLKFGDFNKQAYK